MNTVLGIVCDRDGVASREELVPGPDRPQLRMRASATPSGEIRREQAPVIPVDWHHDGVAIGRVVHLELDRHDRLWAIAEVDDGVGPFVPVNLDAHKTVLVEQPLYWSASRYGGPDFGGLLFDSIALTPSPASLGARPVRFLPGDIHSRATWNISGQERELLTRAAERKLRHRHGQPLIVEGAIDPDHLPIPPGSYVRRRREGTGLPAGWRWSGQHGQVLRVN